MSEVKNDKGQYLSTELAYLNEVGDSIVYSGLNIEQVEFLATLTLNQDKVDNNSKFRNELMSHGLAMIIHERLNALGKTITNSALALASDLADRPGVAVLIVIDLLNHMESEMSGNIELIDVVNTYKNGFYDLEDKQMRKIIDMCKDRSIRFSEIY